LDEREIVARAIHLGSPPRIGLRYAFDFVRSDIVDRCYAEEDRPGHSRGEDEWGCTWSRLGGRIESSFGHVTRSPLEVWGEYDPPDPDSPGRFEPLRELEGHTTKYRAGSFPFPVFNRLMFLRGTKNLMKDFYTNPVRIRRLAGEVLDFARGVIRGYGASGLDAVWFGDDLGSQESLMVSTGIWEEFLKPWYSDLFRWTHKEQMDVIFHTCGQTRLILQDLVSIGADALNLNQPDLLGVDWLEVNLKGRTCLFCPVDMQLIGAMEPDEVKVRVATLATSLAAPEGGFVALCDEGKDHGTVPAANVLAMGDAFEGFRHIP
jgi:hypothetical protein